MRDTMVSPASAEVTALRALAWLVTDQDRAMRFLALTGCDSETLRRRAGETEVLGAVLDFLLDDEASLLAFADAVDLPAQSVALARHALPCPARCGDDHPRYPNSQRRSSLVAWGMKT